MYDYLGIAFSILGILLMVNEYIFPFRGEQFFIHCPIGHSWAEETKEYKGWRRRKIFLIIIGVFFAIAGLLLLSRSVLVDTMKNI